MKTSIFIATSLDGYIARKNGDIEWLNSSDNNNDTDDYGYQYFMDSVDVLVMGRNSFEKVLSFGEWPYSKKLVIVLSHQNISFPAELKGNVELSSQSPTKLLCSLESRGFYHAYIDGGKTIQSFLREGLINNLIITKIPILLGDGIPLFGTLRKEIALTHLSSQVYDSGFVQSIYEVEDAIHSKT